MSSSPWRTLEEEFAYYAGIVNTTYFVRTLLNVPMKEKTGDLAGIGEATTALTDFWEKSGLKGFLTTLLGPAVKEIGLSLEDTAKHYRLNNLIRITEKSNKKLKDRDIEIKSIDKSFAIQWIEAASLIENENLEEKWAELLIYKISGRKAQEKQITILKGLSPIDANILDILLKFSKERTDPNTALKGKGIEEILQLKGISLCSEDIQESIEDLISTGLCQKGFFKAGMIEPFSMSDEIVDLTPTGIRFMNAVSKNS